MEHRFKSFEQGKPRIYRFYDEPYESKLNKIIPLHLSGMSNEYIAAELAISHTVVMKKVKEYENNQDIQD